jgi:hypothetical protein
MAETTTTTTTPAPTEDGILRRLAAVLSQQPRDDDDDHAEGKPIPYHRWAEGRRQLREAREALAALQAQVEQLRTAHVAALAEVRTAAAREVRDLGQRHAEDLALVDLGVTDPGGREALRAEFLRIPEATRPKEGPARWWTDLLAARKAKPEETAIPRTLLAYLPQEQAPTGDGQRGSGVQGPGLPRVEIGVQQGRQPSAAESIRGAGSFADLLKITSGLDRSR